MVLYNTSLSFDTNEGINVDLLFLPIAVSGDVSSIRDVATLELLADFRPNTSS